MNDHTEEIRALTQQMLDACANEDRIDALQVLIFLICSVSKYDSPSPEAFRGRMQSTKDFLTRGIRAQIRS